jgi:multiple sugar transport system ATP-binding protein
MSLVNAKVVVTPAGAALEGDGGWRWGLSQANSRKALSATGNSVILGARHSTILLHPQSEPGAIPSRIYTVEPTGDVTYVHLFLGNSIIIASVPPDVRLRPDEMVWIEFDQDRLHLFDEATERALQAA